VFKEYPVISADSRLAAKAALAAHKQGKYVEMHEALMKYRGSFTREVIAKAARSIGADPNAILSDMSSPDIDAQITRNVDLATLLGVRGTPNFLIGPFLISGAISYEDMKKVITEARKGS
jgi:protein-disulfide isomerase